MSGAPHFLARLRLTPAVGPLRPPLPSGINTDEDYPYTAEDGQCDERKLKRHVVTIDDYQDVPANNEKALLKVWRGAAGIPAGEGA